MPGLEAPTGAAIGVPAGAFGAVEAGGVEAEAGDYGEGVAGTGVNGDPAAAAALAEAEEIGGLEGGAEDAGVVKGIGDGAGAIVAGIGEGAVAAAPFVGFAAEGVGGPDGTLDGLGSV